MRLAGVLALLPLLATSACAAAWGHGWYHPECCHDQDCAPVIKTEVVQPFAYAGATATGPQVPVLWVTTRHGRAAVPQNMIPKESKDQNAHACIRLGKVICYYVPPSI
jgi:hypothetical protein